MGTTEETNLNNVLGKYALACKNAFDELLDITTQYEAKFITAEEAMDDVSSIIKKIFMSENQHQEE